MDFTDSFVTTIGGRGIGGAASFAAFNPATEAVVVTRPTQPMYVRTDMYEPLKAALTKRS